MSSNRRACPPAERRVPSAVPSDRDWLSGQQHPHLATASQERTRVPLPNRKGTTPSPLPPPYPFYLADASSFCSVPPPRTTRTERRTILSCRTRTRSTTTASRVTRTPSAPSQPTASTVCRAATTAPSECGTSSRERAYTCLGATNRKVSYLLPRAPGSRVSFADANVRSLDRAVYSVVLDARRNRVASGSME